MNSQPQRHQRGYSFVDQAITLAIVSILVSAGLSEFDKLRSRLRVQAVASQLQTDLQHARSMAVAANQMVRVHFDEDSSGSCYVIHTGAANSCRCSAAEGSTCGGGAVARQTVRFIAAAGAPQVRANVSSIGVDPQRGTVTPTATMSIANSNGDELRAIVNIMGRVRTCVASGSIVSSRPC